MNGPAKYGAIVYSKDIGRLAKFYIGFFGMVLLKETEQLISLGKDGFNIVIHVPPVEISGENFGSVKLFLTVDNLALAKDSVESFGGKSLPGEWSNPIFKVCNIVDPDGNHVQLREFSP